MREQFWRSGSDESQIKLLGAGDDGIRVLHLSSSGSTATVTADVENWIALAVKTAQGGWNVTELVEDATYSLGLTNNNGAWQVASMTITPDAGSGP